MSFMLKTDIGIAEIMPTAATFLKSYEINVLCLVFVMLTIME